MKKLTIIFLSVFMLIGCNNNSKNTIKSDDFVITINDVTITEKNKYGAIPADDYIFWIIDFEFTNNSNKEITVYPQFNFWVADDTTYMTFANDIDNFKSTTLKPNESFSDYMTFTVLKEQDSINLLFNNDFGQETKQATIEIKK